jgi:hypothetical protein
LIGQIYGLRAKWKDKFAASKFWNHNLAEKILGLCTQNELPAHGFSLQKEIKAWLSSVAWSLLDEKLKFPTGQNEFGLLCHLQNTPFGSISLPRRQTYGFSYMVL